MDERDLTPGDPLWSRPEPAPETPSETPERPGYGEGPVPPGAFAPRPRPQRLPPDVVFADWWRRAVAAILDGLIVGGITLAILAFASVGFFADGEVGWGDIIVGGLLATALFVALAFLYAPLVMARTNGQTLGKMATSVRVVRANGRPVEFGWAVMREVVVKGLVFGLLGVFTGGIANLIDWAWPFVDREERALHDFLVDSRVIRA
jgi:uncharacterized RDD family membrane protein YckC